jgi:hypothetical protein
VLEQVIANNDVVDNSSRELFVFLILRVRLVVDDEVDDGGPPVGLDDESFLALGWYQVWLGGRILLELHHGAVERLDEDSL